ncbi:probable disease resistance protein At5g66900 isoform X2 [Rutidosis leptorrhynchoides]|uniref:probable disease resistance protein At5g66900 isoform X2 n=1 Tax=Rutidosis leptorrhynchoides TaxID=125765 RepID=UPI003A990CA4
MESLLVVALHLVFGEMLKVTVQLAKNHGKFETLLKRLKKTLNRIQPIIDDIKKSREQLNYSEEEIKEFTNCLTKGKKLVLKCSEIKSWNLLEKYVYAYKLIRLDKDLLRIFQIDVPAKLLSDKKTLLVEIGVLKKKLDVLINVARGVKRLCGVLDLKVLIDGLKHGLLNDDTCIVLILAPGGNSVEMICHDKEKKDLIGGLRESSNL